MPPILAAFFILSGLLHGSTLAGGLTKGVDPTAHTSNKGWRAPIFYDAWTTPNDYLTTRGEAESCKFRFYFLTNSHGGTRLRIGGKEQLLNTAWHFDHVTPKDHRTKVPFEFLDPVTGKSLRKGILESTCVDSIRLNYQLKEEGWIR